MPARTRVAAALIMFAGAAPLDAQLQPVTSAGDEVRIGAWLQPAWEYRGIEDDEDRQGFFLRRARLDVTGGILEGRVRFRLMPDLARSPGLRDAWVELRGGGAGIRMGQQTVPFDFQRERSMASGHFGDRAIASRRFELAGGRDVGVVGYVQARDGRIQLYGGAFNGQGANRTDPGRVPLLGGRALVSVGGAPSRGETDLARTPDPVVTLGAGAMRHRESFLRPRPGFSADRAVAWHSWTADAHARWRGVSLAGSWFEQRVDAEGNDERGDGFFVSGGALVPGHDVEMVVRHSRATWDAARDAGPDIETSVGLTFFHMGHGLQTRVQFTRERLFAGSATERRTNILTIEHQLLLGG
jgi:hypothetical protein